MSERNPRSVRFAPGDDAVEPDDQIPERPTDSAAWMNMIPQGYDSPLFDEGEFGEGFDPTADEEATDG